MDFKQLLTYTTVVDCASFTKAAEQLYLSQPTVSAHIHALEEEAGTPLLLRTTKSLTVTPAGKRFYEYASGILALRTRMLQACSDEAGQHIRIGASTIPSSYVLPELLAEYHTLRPEVRFTVSQGDSRGIIDGIAAGLYDLGFTGMEDRTEGLRFLPFCRDDMVLIAPDREPWRSLRADDQGLTAALLAGPVILREEGSGSGSQFSAILRSLGIHEEALQVLARVSDQTAIISMVAAGMGCACVSSRAARLAADRQLFLILPLHGRAAQRSLYLVFREVGPVADHIKAFTDFLLSRADSGNEA